MEAWMWSPKEGESKQLSSYKVKICYGEFEDMRTVPMETKEKGGMKKQRGRLGFCVNSDDVGCFIKGEGPMAHVKMLPQSPTYIRTKFLLYTKESPNKGIGITPNYPFQNVLDLTRSVAIILIIVSNIYYAFP